MFALAAPGLLEEMLGDAGFLDVTVDGVELGRERASIDGFIGQTIDLSKAFADVFLSLSEAQRAEVVDLIRTLAEPFTSADGSVRFPGRSLVALASA